MKALLLLVVVAVMSSGVRGISQSRSCSTINGKTVCTEEQSDGNYAGAASQAVYGGGQSYQGAYADTGNTRTGDFSSSSEQVGQPPQGYQGYQPSQGDQAPQGYQGYQPSQGDQAPQGYVSSSSSSSSGSGPSYVPFSPFVPVAVPFGGAGGAFAGAGAFPGPGGAFAGAGAFPGFGGAFAGAGGAYAGAGPLPFYGRR